MIHRVADRTISRRRINHEVYRGIQLERIKFDNCVATGCTFREIELHECRLWSCTLFDPMLEDVLADDVRTTIVGGGGKRQPFFVFGGVARHVRLQGRLGALVWNPPYASLKEGPSAAELDAVRAFYDATDWALDVSRARFQTVPAFRFGPPGHLVRRDPVSQPLVRRDRALAVDWRSLGLAVGVWRVVLEWLVNHEWPESTVLVPAPLGRKYREEIEGINALRSLGVAE